MDYKKNYYQELGLDKNATQEQIKKAYRKLALKYHPDKNKGDKTSEERFQKINEANSILSENNKKQEYDQRSPNGKAYSPNPFEGMFGGGGQGFEFHFGGQGGQGSSIFDQMFGDGNPFSSGGFDPFQRQEFREVLDLELSKTITLKDVYKNDNLTLKYNKYVTCDQCKGSGFDNKSESYECDVCDGTGIHDGRVCKYCKGDGKVYKDACKKCDGEKIAIKESEVTIQNINQIRQSIRNVHRGYGHQSKYYLNKVGSLLLTINLDRNDEYEIINNYELHKTIDIHYQDAINGKKFTFNHIDDSKIEVEISEKTKDGDIITIKEKGLLMNNNKRADLYLKINIIIDYNKI